MTLAFVGALAFFPVLPMPARERSISASTASSQPGRWTGRAISRPISGYSRAAWRARETGANTIKWTSKYGSVIASAYDISTSDGVNEAVSLQTSSGWRSPSTPSSTAASRASASRLAQYVLDNFATVDEAVEALRRSPYHSHRQRAGPEPPGDAASVDLGRERRQRDLREHQGSWSFITTVVPGLTNSPIFDHSCAEHLWHRSRHGHAARHEPRCRPLCPRLVLHQRHPKFEDPNLRWRASSASSDVSVPFGISTPNEPNISSTRWRTVFDHKRQLYFFIGPDTEHFLGEPQHDRLLPPPESDEARPRTRPTRTYPATRPGISARPRLNS